MPRTPLDTPNRRAARAAARRQRRRELTIAGSVLGVTLVLGASAWAYFSASGQKASVPIASSTAPASGAPREAGSRPATLTVTAVGDMIFDNRVRDYIETSGGAAPLAPVAARLAQADVTVGNLESVLTNSRADEASKAVVLRGDLRGIESLKTSGFNLISVANNHALDYGPKSLAESLAALDRAGIAHAGAGPNVAAAWKPALIRAGNASVAYLAFTFVVPPGFAATPGQPGVASGRKDIRRIESAIRKAKRANDYVIVSFHWGTEFDNTASAEQIKVAHRCIDAGANMVLAHHPHAIQGVELYRRGLIAYSLGDFAFAHLSREADEALILDAKLGPGGVSDVTVTPTYLDAHGSPQVVTGKHADTIFLRLRRLSQPLNTKIAINGDTASVTR